MSKNEIAASQVRAGVIGLLQSCRCLYPIHHYPTETLHDVACPAHAMTLSARAASSELMQVGGWFDVSLDIDTPAPVRSASDRFARSRR